MAKAVTIKEIAGACMVSMNTVSRAINGKPDVNPETRKRVLKYAKQVGFVPNCHARGLSSGKRFLIGYITRLSLEPRECRLMVSVIEAAQRLGYGTICRTPMTVDVPGCVRLIDSICVHNPEGVLLDATLVGSEIKTIVSLMRKRGIPLVVLNADAVMAGCSSVIRDTRKASRIATQYLFQQGFDQVAFFGWAQESGRPNVDGYREACVEHGQPFDEDLVIDTYGISGAEARFALISDRLTRLRRKYVRLGLYATTSFLAAFAEKVALAQGARIPDQLGLIGLYDNQFGEVTVHPFPCCRTDLVAMAKAAVRFIVEERLTRRHFQFEAKWEIAGDTAFKAGASKLA